MGLHSSIGQLTTVSLLANQSKTANVAGSLIDLGAFVGSVVIRQDTGDATAGDDNSTYTCYIQHADDNNASNVVNANINITAATNVAAINENVVDTRDLKRWVRVVGNIAGGNSPAFPISVTVTGYRQYD